MTASEGLDVTVTADGVVVITLNRPQHRNALDEQMRDLLRRQLLAAEEAPEIRVVVVVGSGGNFCSGAALGSAASPTPQSIGDRYEGSRRHESLYRACRTVTKPIVAGIEGVCYGAGLMLAAHCDIRVASESACFGLIEARMGSSGPSILPLIIGPQWTKYLLFTGDDIDAWTARDIGLVLEVCESGTLLDRVMSLAERIAAMPAGGVRLNKLAVSSAEEVMGWEANSQFQALHAAVTNSEAVNAESAGGRNLRRVLVEEGFQAFKVERDAAFGKRWIGASRRPELLPGTTRGEGDRRGDGTVECS